MKHLSLPWPWVLLAELTNSFQSHYFVSLAFQRVETGRIPSLLCSWYSVKFLEKTIRIKNKKTNSLNDKRTKH